MENPAEDPPLAGVESTWGAVVEDMEATAAEYREDGWSVVELHPGDVAPMPGAGSVEERYGLDVVVSGSEFEEVESVVADADFAEYDVYRAQEGDLVFLVLAMKAAETRQVVLVPLYYRVPDAEQMIDQATVEGELHTYVRPLSDDRRVVFTQDDPEPLLPAAPDED